MKKGLVILAAAAGVIVLALCLTYANRASIVQKAIQKQVEHLTGTRVEVSIPNVDKGLKIVNVSSLKIMNPQGYKNPVLAELEDVHLNCNWLGILAGQGVQCDKVQGKLSAVYLERHQPQGFNLKDLKVFSEEDLNQPSQQKSFHIARYELSFARAEIHEYVTGQAEAQTTEIDLGSRVEVYSQISDPAVLIYAPALRIIPEFKRGNMGIPRSLLQKKIAKAG